MTFFERLRRKVVNNGTLINSPSDRRFKNPKIFASGCNGIDILYELANPRTARGSYVRDLPPKHLPGTREEYVEDVINWAVYSVGTDERMPLFWMKGPVGVGKSVIAQASAEKLKGMGKLGATFVFAANKRDKVAQFFPTIIHELSREFPDYRSLVDQRIRRDRNILNKKMSTLFRALVVEPVLALQRSGKSIGKRIVIIVDGLDQCDDPDAQCEIVKIIAAATRSKTLPLCWAFFSRPEPHIEGVFATSNIAHVTCAKLLPASRGADGDIELYLHSGFAKVLRRRTASLKSQWPSDGDVRTLLRAANGLTIYIATVLRVVDQYGSFPEASLRAILATVPNHGTVTDASVPPSAGLDALYMLIMERIHPEILPVALLLLNLLCSSTPNFSADPLSALFASNAVGLSEFAFKEARNQLSAVVRFHDQDGSPPVFTLHTSLSNKYAETEYEILNKLGVFIKSRLGGSVSFYHKSFYDFLMDSKRSGRFCVVSPDVCDALFDRCIKVHLELQDSYNFQGSELVLAPGVPDSGSSLSYPHTNESVNSTLKTRVLLYVHGVCFGNLNHPYMDSRLLQRFRDIDFRTHLQIYTAQTIPSGPFPTGVWGYKGHAKVVSSTRISQHFSRDPLSFLTEFEKMIERLQQAGVVRPCGHGCTSSITYPSPTKSRNQFISGLYYMGDGSKSIYWYWEFDTDSGLYREIVTMDLYEAERVYRDERFDLWPFEGR